MVEITARAEASAGSVLPEKTIRDTFHKGLRGRYTGARVLVLIPDHTRSLPLPFLFRQTVENLHDTENLDFMVALGTHPPLDDAALLKLVGITPEERSENYRHISLLNHAWDREDMLAEIGILDKELIKSVAGDDWHPSLGGDVSVRINRLIDDYDQIIILAPTFPHEVVGFSGGAKYLFPGISGPEMINITHWLAALRTSMKTIGIKNTPVRRLIHEAIRHIRTPVTLVSLVVEGEDLAGIFIGDIIGAWENAASLSSERHITWIDKPYIRVLSRAPEMYDELWTAAKAMYKLEPAVADGGEVIVYAPHLRVISHVHGNEIFKAGYHVRDYFLAQWERFKNIPLGVLAHGTHLRGSGTYKNGVERGRINVRLSSQIPEEECRTLGLGYIDPNDIDIANWKNREDEGILYVPKAGEKLYRVRA